VSDAAAQLIAQRHRLQAAITEAKRLTPERGGL
jgi:hypothetical protein